MNILLLSLLTLLPDGNYAALSADSTAIVAGKTETTLTDTLVTFSKMRVCPLKKVSSAKFLPDYSRVLLEPVASDTAQSPYYIYKFESLKCERLSSNFSQNNIVISPDGKKIAYVRDNNVIIKRLEYKTEIQVTSDGSDAVLNGINTPDLKEAFNFVGTIVWSPGSDYVVFSKNAKLYMYSIQYKWTKEITLPDADATYITAVEWSTSPDFFGVMYLNKEQTLLRMAEVDAGTFISKKVYEYKASKYIDPICATFLKFIGKDNKFLVLRTESGYRQLHLYSSLGKPVAQVTTDRSDVIEVTGYDTISRRLHYISSDALSKKECSITADGKKYQVLKTSKYLTDSQQLHNVGDLYYYIVKPSNASDKTPLIMYVSDFMSEGDNAFETAMVERGYAVAVVKPHGTEGQGSEFREASYLNIFNLPAEDYINVVKDIVASGSVDADRISIIGSGLNAGVALSAILKEDNPFSSAVVIAPVADLRLYNGIVTERLMKTELATPAYRENCAVDKASLLNKKLLILHSSGDKNISIANTEALSKALVESGIQFDMQIFFGKDENFTDNLVKDYLITKITNYIR